MKIQQNDKSEAKELRQKAEEKLKNRKSTKVLQEVDISKLIHELQVHQIELEMQNEELTKAREEADASMEKYVDLYDFAPFGYVTLSEEKNITDLNFSAASLLGYDRSHLKNTRFGLYIAPESLDLYNDFFERIFQFREKRSCELSLRSKTDKAIYVHIDALVSESLNICLITMIDITKRKEMELELQKAMYQLKELNSYFLSREIRMVDLKKEINELLVKSGCEKEFLM